MSMKLYRVYPHPNQSFLLPLGFLDQIRPFYTIPFLPRRSYWETNGACYRNKVQRLFNKTAFKTFFNLVEPFIWTVIFVNIIKRAEPNRRKTFISLNQPSYREYLGAKLTACVKPRFGLDLLKISGALLKQESTCVRLGKCKFQLIRLYSNVHPCL